MLPMRGLLRGVPTRPGPARGLCRMQNRELSFEDPRSAFAGKSSWELVRALAVLRMCSYPLFVENAEKWFEASQRVPLVRGAATTLVGASFYRQFVGGREDREILPLVRRLTSAGVRPMLVCTMEEDVGQDTDSFHETLYDRNLERFLSCLSLARRAFGSPCLQLKMTSLFCPDALERVSRAYTALESKLRLVESTAECMVGKDTLDFPNVSAEDRKHLVRGIQRLATIGRAVCALDDARLLVDAEYSYVNPSLSLLCLAMQGAFNSREPRIWNTYQCYLKDAQKNILEERGLTEALGVCFGAKLVRGAYIALEKRRALATGQPDPVCSSYEDTNNNYDRCLDLLVSMVKESGPRCAFVAATHNENSIRLLLNRMKEEGLEPGAQSINFAQLYGMCDQVTYPLGSRGYNVYKSIPVGPLQEAIPYLARRATENQSVLAGARKEQQLLRAELRHRLTGRTLFK